MLRIILCLAVLLAPAAALADLTADELFLLYVERMPAETTAARMKQLYSNLEPGAFKTQAAAVLKQELADKLSEEAAALQPVLDAQGVCVRIVEKVDYLDTACIRV